MDQTSSSVEAVAALALDCRQQVAGVGEEAEQVSLGGGEALPLPHQPIDLALPLPNALGGALPPVLQLSELRNKFRAWERQVVRESGHEHVDKSAIRAQQKLRCATDMCNLCAGKKCVKILTPFNLI